MRLQEISPNTLQGSWTSDLLLRKLWGLTELKKIKDKFDTVYILGSWYGNASIIMSLLKKHIEFDHIVNVDNDPAALEKSKEVIDKLGINHSIEFMLADANELDYRQLSKDGLVINFSTVDIEGTAWFRNIPKGALVLIQARNNVKSAANQFKSEKDLAQSFPLSKLLYKGSKEFKDPEIEFTSFMIIGQK